MSVQLKNLRPWESVDTVIRRHWIVFFVVGLYFLGGWVISGIIFFLFGFGASGFALNILFWMYYSMFLFIMWLNHELDLIVVTNNRVICIEQKSFLNRNVAETTLDKVQEAGIETKWFFANILDYGTMTLKTAGASSYFDMTFVPRPMEQGRHINNIVDKYRDTHSFRTKDEVARMKQVEQREEPVGIEQESISWDEIVAEVNENVEKII